MLYVKNLSFGYTTESFVLQNINFSLKSGELLCVMGESGCGKSTLLKTIYGLVDLNKGSVFWNDEQILGPEFHLVPGFEKFKYVAQDFDLMPYITVAENIKKHLSRFYPKKAEKRCAELLEVIELTHLANEKVKHLSGGQQQRVAIARALAKEPELLLLDEPFSQIDNFKKNSLRRSLFSYLKKQNIACVIATHDGNDALSFADSMLIIQHNKVIENGNPKTIYKHPKSKYIASLFDDVNEITLNEKKKLLYPNQLKIVEKSTYKATVLNTYFKGFYWLIECEFKQQKLFIVHHQPLEVEREIYISFIENSTL